MVFQEYALFPHLDVAGNIGFGLRGSANENARRVNEMLELVGLTGLGKRMPFELSGGQQQRVALARALAPQPEVLLLDEPFSNLDAALRMQVRGEVRSILKAAGITGVFVTHDQEEALSLADEVAVMMHGRVVQSAPPEVLYSHPATRDVAAFVGEANFLRGQAEDSTVQCILGRLPLIKPAEGAVFILIRPENIHLTAIDGEGNASVIWREFYGHDQRVGLRLRDNTKLVARLDSLQTYPVGQALQVEIVGEVRVFAL
jgi:iron(III) transport system ATP-binding protein